MINDCGLLGPWNRSQFKWQIEILPFFWGFFFEFMLILYQSDVFPFVCWSSLVWLLDFLCHAKF